MERLTACEATERPEAIHDVAEKREDGEQLHTVSTALIKHSITLLIWCAHLIITHIADPRQEVLHISQRTS